MYKLCFCQLYYGVGYDLFYDLVAHGARVSQKGSGVAGTQNLLQKTHSHPTPDGYEN